LFVALATVVHSIWQSGMCILTGLQNGWWRNRSSVPGSGPPQTFAPVWGSPCPPSKWYRRFPLHKKRPGRETDYSSPSVVEVKNAWNHNFPPRMCLHIMHKDNFTFSLYCTMTIYCDTDKENKKRV